MYSSKGNPDIEFKRFVRIDHLQRAIFFCDGLSVRVTVGGLEAHDIFLLAHHFPLGKVRQLSFTVRHLHRQAGFRIAQVHRKNRAALCGTNGRLRQSIRGEESSCPDHPSNEITLG